MTEQIATPPQEPIGEGKYARIERERRFLLAGPPPTTAVTAPRRITDRYLPGTRLRLRRVDYLDSGARELKFTQKVPAGRPGYIQGLITSTYLSAAEYDLLASLPAQVLTKTRLSVPPLSIDLFDPPLHGLVMADAEFSTDEEAQSFLQPPAAVAEVTDDARFTGGSLVRARRHDLLAWLAEYGIEPSRSNELNSSTGIDNYSVSGGGD
jgi:CYTH domain-containing protein